MSKLHLKLFIAFTVLLITFYKHLIIQIHKKELVIVKENMLYVQKACKSGQVFSILDKDSNISYLTAYKFCAQPGQLCQSGKPLPVTTDIQAVVRSLLNTAVNLTKGVLDDFVFVTGVSSSHMKESMDAVASIQKHHPQHRILYYDWGLTDQQACVVMSWCNVTLVQLNLEKFRYRDKSQYYAWKAITVVHALLHHTGVMWFDSSIRFTTDDITSCHQMALSNGGIAFFSSVGFVHSTYAVTHRMTYLYLPTDLQKMQQEGHVQSGIMLIYRTRYVIENVLQWWLLCSIEDRCIRPLPPTECDFRESRLRVYAGCHRYDQSVLNILLANVYNFTINRYLISDSMVRIQRKHTKVFNLQECSDGNV